jgi:1,4-alpha-glucan branching enzyme
MKPNKNQNHTPGAGPRLVPVRFEFSQPAAIAVSIAGTFNDWHPATRSMRPLGSGYWLGEMALVPGIYEYCLVVDGRWMPDPLARETVPNPFGGRNSILKVARSPEAAHLDDAENLPLKNLNETKTHNL